LRGGDEDEFVVTWLMNTNFHFGVLGKEPAAPDDAAGALLTPVQALNAIAAAAAAPPVPNSLRSRTGGKDELCRCPVGCDLS